MPSAYLQWRFHSGERVVARGPLVLDWDARLLMGCSKSWSEQAKAD